jgi:hypothetical protein
MLITDAALLVLYGDTDTAAVDPTISHYKAITKYMGWQDRGIVSQSEVKGERLKDIQAWQRQEIWEKAFNKVNL